MRELMVKVTEKEAKSIGERRWFRASWKSRVPLMIVCLTAAFVMEAIIPDDTTTWVKALIIFPFVVGFLVSYYYFFVALDRAGKTFVWKIKNG